LRSEPITDQSDLVHEFRAGLKDAGFVDRENVAVEVNSSEGQVAKLPGLVADRIRKPVAVIVGNIAPAQAAKTAITTVPLFLSSGMIPSYSASCRALIDRAATSLASSSSAAW
jgi:putative ABC transport system substrate-binding protein